MILAVDIGGTKFAAGLVTAKGELIDRARVEVERDVVPEAHYTSLAGMVTEMMARARDQHHARIRAVGVGAAGPVARNLETVSPVNIPAWREFPLRARLARHDRDCRSTVTSTPRRSRWPKGGSAPRRVIPTSVR